MSNVRQTELLAESTSIAERFSTAVVGVGFLVFVTSWAILFQWLPDSTSVLGLSLYRTLGLALLAMGLGTLAVGVASYAGVLATEPADSAGLVVGVLFGLLGLLAGALVGSETLGFGLVGWLPLAATLGVGTAALSVLPREDLGSTLPTAGLLLLVGGTFAGGFVSRGWSWVHADLSVTFVASVVVPGLSIFAALVGIWSAAKARGGFGARGRQHGAFLLVETSVAGMLAVLALLVGFIVVNGLDTVTTGGSVGLGGTLKLFGIALPFVDVRAPFLTNVSQSLFIDVSGVLPAIMGTLWLVVGAVLFAVPLGVGAAVFLTEYAESRRFTGVVEVATNGLWSTPSIVFGLFGLAFLLPRVSRGQRSLLGGMLVLGFMLLPLVVITSRESIKAVPDEYRDASAALGVSKWQTVRSVVLPAAMPGVITGVILGIGRIAGETAPLLLVFGGPPFANSTPNVLGSFRITAAPPFVSNEALMEAGSALPYQLYTTITSGQVPGETFSAEQFGWGTALVLLIVVLGLYAIGIAGRLYFRRKLYHE